MNNFWLTSALLCFVALLFVLLPVLLRKRIQRQVRAQEAEERERANVLNYKERLRELTKERAAGTLSEEDFEALKCELEDGLLDDVDDASQVDNGLAATRTQVLVLVLIGLVTLPVAYLLYNQWGAYDAVLSQQTMHTDSDSLQQAVALAEAGDPRSLLANLRSKLEQSPDNIEGWALLARTAMAVQDYALAAEAYQKLSVLEEEPMVRASVFGMLAQSYYFSGRSFDDPLTSDALSQSLAINPDETNSIGLQAIASFQDDKFAEAVSYWQRVLTIAPNHPARASIESGIKRAQQLMEETGSESVVLVDQQASPFEAVGSKSILLKVTVPESIAAKYSPDTTVFVFAKAVTGPPLPLAVKKLTLADLPLTLTLDDSLAMRPELALSKFDRVNVVARISLSGQPSAGSGDIEGGVSDVEVGQSELILIEISKEL